MEKRKYRTTPVPSTKMPGGIPFIIGNEFAERFSFYGMKGILAVFMTKHLMDSNGDSAVMTENNATFWVHIFVTAVYFTPFLGALISDIFFGKYKTIVTLSLVYCLGHLVLALDETRLGLTLGLTLIAIGAGGIKPCVSAHVGDQFGKSNRHLLQRVFNWFYFSINLGSFISMISIPLMLENFGPHVAFGIPGLLMLIATIVFWMGRNRFIHIPSGGKASAKEIFSREGLSILGRLSIIYLFVAMFWSLFDQTASAWVFQAEKMDRNWMGIEWLSSQIQAANPLLILILIPFCSFVVYPAIDKIFKLTPLRKISIGFFIMTFSFLISTYIQTMIDRGDTPNISWQLLAYVILTLSEVMVSITCLEFSYRQAPNRMKSVVMSLFLFSVAFGNLFTALVNKFIQNEDGTSKLEGASYYWFFTLAMLVTAVLFIFVAMAYREKTYIQGETEAAPSSTN